MPYNTIAQMLNGFNKLFGKKPELETKKATLLSHEAALLLHSNIVKPDASIVLGYEGVVTAKRLVDSAAKEKFGPTVTDVPLTGHELKILIDEKLVDLSEKHLKEVYEASQGEGRKEIRG